MLNQTIPSSGFELLLTLSFKQLASVTHVEVMTKKTITIHSAARREKAVAMVFQMDGFEEVGE